MSPEQKCTLLTTQIEEYYWNGRRVVYVDNELFNRTYQEAIDIVLENAWKTLEDVPMNPETECIEEKWFHFPNGTNREDIWYWFDAHHSKGVAWLMNEFV